MQLNRDQEQMIEGKKGRGPQKAMEILTALAEAQDAEQLVPITYAHLMPPDVMFFPYGKQGAWAHEMMDELIKDVERLTVPATIEPKFCDLSIAKDLGFPDDVIQQMHEVQDPAVKFYEDLGVIPTYSALPFYARPGKIGEHVSIAESISILWYNTNYGCRCERDDGVTSLSAAITGYCPLAGTHKPENRHGEVIIQLGDDLDFNTFNDADWDAFSLASSRLCKEKRPVFLGMPKNIGVTALKHLFAPIAVESGLAVMHIVEVTPEARTLEMALAGKKPQETFVISKKQIDEAYELANTTSDSHIDYVLLGCPHLTMKELRDLAQTLDGKKISPNVKLIAVTTEALLNQAEDMGYAQAIQNAGGILTCSMCIAFAGTQARGVLATNSIKAVFFYAGFSADNTRKVRFGSIVECARASLSGKWEGRI